MRRSRQQLDTDKHLQTNPAQLLLLLTQSTLTRRPILGRSNWPLPPLAYNVTEWEEELCHRALQLCPLQTRCCQTSCDLTCGEVVKTLDLHLSVLSLSLSLSLKLCPSEDGHLFLLTLTISEQNHLIGRSELLPFLNIFCSLLYRSTTTKLSVPKQM